MRGNVFYSQRIKKLFIPSSEIRILGNPTKEWTPPQEYNIDAVFSMALRLSRVTSSTSITRSAVETRAAQIAIRLKVITAVSGLLWPIRPSIGARREITTPLCVQRNLWTDKMCLPPFPTYPAIVSSLILFLPPTFYKQRSWIDTIIPTISYPVYNRLESHFEVFYSAILFFSSMFSFVENCLLLVAVAYGFLYCRQTKKLLRLPLVLSLSFPL